MANATDVVGYAYDAALHCVDCTLAHFNIDSASQELIDTREDSEGNKIHPVFNGEDARDGVGTISASCDDCGEELVG